MAKNNLKVNDLQFQQQLITTVSSVLNLYWDLVSFNQDIKVKESALVTSRRLYEDNKKQVEIGTLAPIEVTRAEAEVASNQQDLVISQTNLLQQETILKNALSKNGVASPSLADVRIVPLDSIQVPEKDVLPPFNDLVDQAMKRPARNYAEPDQHRQQQDQPERRQELVEAEFDRICGIHEQRIDRQPKRTERERMSSAIPIRL